MPGRWPVPHPLPRSWPRRRHYALIKISAPKGIPNREVRREVKTMVNELRYSDGFPGEIRLLFVKYVSDVSRIGFRYHLEQLPLPPTKGEIDARGRRRTRSVKIRRKRKAKAEAAKDVVPRRRKSPWS